MIQPWMISLHKTTPILVPVKVVYIHKLHWINNGRADFPAYYKVQK